MPMLWAMTVNFDSVAVGDMLPILIKWETEDTIRRYASIHGEGAGEDGAPMHLPRQTVVSYITELLGKGFPPDRLEADGSSLEVEHLLPVFANDTISLSGRVVGKRTEEGQRLVECAAAVENDRGEPVARARAVVSL